MNSTKIESLLNQLKFEMIKEYSDKTILVELKLNHMDWHIKRWEWTKEAAQDGDMNIGGELIGDGSGE